MLLNFFLIVSGIGLVSFGAKYVVDGASAIAKRYNISDLVIGLTVVSFGTSAPELVVSVLAAQKGTAELALGNVIGSNIVNICLILGLTAIIQPLRIQRNTVYKEIPFSLLGVLVAFFLAGDMFIDGAARATISRSDGFVLLSFFAIYLYYMFEVARQSPAYVVTTQEARPTPFWLAAGLTVGGLLGLVFGGQLIVTGAVAIARGYGISEAIIGLTLVAIGTSIPELATSVVAALRGKADLAVGNVIGSNIFNIFFILGLSSSVAPISLGSISLVDFGVCILATLLVFVCTFIARPRILFRLEGGILLSVYVLYTAWLLYQL